MSGSSGGGDGPPWRETPIKIEKSGEANGDGSGAPSDPCFIVEITSLNSVDRAVVAGLVAGQPLTLVYQPGPPQRLIAEASPGTVAGSITSPAMLQLIQCMQSGRSYQAIVLTVRGAQVQVRIEPV